MDFNKYAASPGDNFKYAEPSEADQDAERHFEHLLGDIDTAIETYIAEQPLGEQVAVAVACALGERVNRSRDKVRKRLNRTIRSRIHSMFGTKSLLMHGKRGDPIWTQCSAGPYVRYRVRERSNCDRILLDTCVVRKLLTGGVDGLDRDFLDRLSAAKGGRPVSIVDSVWAEFHRQLRSRSGSEFPPGWRQTLEQLNDLLDPQMPVAPIGAELLHYTGLMRDPKGPPRESTLAESRRAWSHVYSATDYQALANYIDFDDMQRKFGHRFRGLRERIERIPRSTLEAYCDADSASTHITNRRLEGLRAEGKGPQFLSRMELFIRMDAELSTAVILGQRTLRKNDDVDLELAMVAGALDAWVCTDDGPFVGRPASAGSVNQDRIVRHSEIVARLESLPVE